jgi:tRNA(adenine34) deaminase
MSDPSQIRHEHGMRLALVEARRALALGEVPIGAVVVAAAGDVTGAGCNRPISAVDPTAHAEIEAMRQAALRVGNYRLTDTTLYVTVEPCLMCVGAMVHARVGLVVYGASEPKSGAIVSAFAAHALPGLNHRLDVVGGVLEEECRSLIQEFFKLRRG